LGSDRFEIEHLAGSGGMSAVYRARDRLTGHPVALKIVHAQCDQDAERVSREARALASLAHPAIVRLVDHGRTQADEPYLALEWLEGESLAARLRRGTLTVAETLTLGARVAEGLGEAHRRGIVHRDIKPSNLLLVGGRIDELKIIDFGVVRLAGERTITQAGAILGTPGFIAPEQARDGKDTDARADVFSLGCVLFRCLTGRLPFEGEDLLSRLLKLALDDAPRLASLCLDAPYDLDDLLARMLSKEREDRPRDGDAVLRALHAIMLRHGAAEAPSRASAALGMFERPMRRVTQAKPGASNETRALPEADPRALLGSASGFVGRERELSMLEAIFDEVRSESVARAVVVTAPEGVGKSRLMMEFVRRIREQGSAELWFGRGDARLAGSPFGLLSGVPFSDENAERAPARRDATSMSDHARCAFEAFVDATCATAPLLIVFDDLQWGDLPSLKLVDAALRGHAERPLMVLALGRPEVNELFPGLWAERALTQMRLAPLGRKASEQLARQALGNGADEATVTHIVDIAAGDVLYLEELLCAVTQDKGRVLPEAVLPIIDARIRRLDPEARRVLRAASIFGASFSRSGVAALLGERASAPWLIERLDELAQRAIIQRRSVWGADDDEYAFRHGLVREAAYETLTDDDRRLGARLASAWRESLP